MFDQSAVEASLRAAGIHTLDYVWSSPAVTAGAAWMLSACRSEDGRVDRYFAFDDLGLIGKANDAWWRLALEHGLLDPDRRFLVSVGPVDDETPATPHWARVRLGDDWNILGAADGVLGGPPGRPGFVMSSLDGSVLIGGTTWQDSISVIALPNPVAAGAIRRFLGLPFLPCGV